MIDQYQLRYFLAVAELGNFSRAAAQVGVTQPTLSAGIAKLEEKLGIKLFDRSKRGVSLTEGGSRFLVHARRIASEFELAVQEVRITPQSRVLRVGVLSTIPTSVIEEIAVRHAREGAGERLELLDGSERDLTDRLSRGRLDVALTVIQPHHQRVRPEPLRGERYLMVLPAGHQFAEAEFVRAEQLANDRMVVRRHCEALHQISRFFTQAGVRPAFALKTSSDQRALALVRAGMGVSMMPESFRDPGVRFVRVMDFEIRREIGLLYAEHAGDLRYGTSPFLSLVRGHYCAA
jgi:DNA-binding transcriptional LysR family regulator